MSDVDKKARDWGSRYSISRARILFENKKHRNPFHAWDAYWWARRNSQPVPDWVMSYLDGCADALKKTEPKNATAVAQALGMAVKGGSSKSKLALCESDRLALFQYVMAIKELEERFERDEASGVVIDPEIVRFERDIDIFAHIAVERDVSIDQVEAAYYEFRS